MNYLLGLLSGVLIATMNIMNAQLSGVWGQNISPIIIHGIGLILIAALCIGKYKSIRKVPKLYLLGGAVGLGTVVFSNLSTGVLGVTVMSVLSLLGQTIASLCVDFFGIMGMPKKHINKEKLISIGLIIIGAVVMILW